MVYLETLEETSSMVSLNGQTVITSFLYGQDHRRRRGDACDAETSEQGPRRPSQSVNSRTLDRTLLLHHTDASGRHPSKMMQLSRRQMPVVSSRDRLVSADLEVC
jgi:hypothetical protein